MHLQVNLESVAVFTKGIIFIGVVVLSLIILYIYMIVPIVIKYKEKNKKTKKFFIQNRETLDKRLAELLKKEKNKAFAYVSIDIDDFRQVNDQLGYEVGNQLIAMFTERLKKATESKCELYDSEGDEFVLVFPEITTKKKLESDLKKINSEMLKNFELEDGSLSIVLEYSAGVSIFPNDAKTKEELITCADIALESAKDSGKNTVCFNSPLLMKKAENKYKMQQSIKKSFINGDFEVDFQPRFGLKEENKLWLVSFVYWNHPSLGKLKAEYFIKYIEELGLISKVDELTLAKTCAKLKYFHEEGIEDVNIAVNMSINQLKRKSFIDRICNILEEYEEFASRITLEINNLIDRSNLELYKDVLVKLKSKGIKIAINNFEIVYDGIAAIKSLPIDEIKLSCEFLKNDLVNKDVLKYIVKIANALNYQTTLIGIELKSEYDFAKEVGVDKVQGNYISKVIDPENMLDNIKKYTKIKK